MTVASLPCEKEADKRAFWQAAALEFIVARKGIAGAEPDEFIAGYLDGFRGVYVKPKKLDGRFWLVWLVEPKIWVKSQRIVQRLMGGVYLDHEGGIIEWPAQWVLILGSIERVGDEPLLSLSMLRGGR